MIQLFAGLLVRFVILTGLQVWVLNNIRLGGYINPWLYVLFIISLPVNMPKSLVLVLAFVSGLSIDIFMNTPGMHTAATVFMAYLRPTWLKMIAPREGYEAEASPRFRKMGGRWFIAYTSFLVFAHHSALFFIEVFRFSEAGSTLLRIFLSSLLTLLLILIAEFLFAKPGDRIDRTLA